MENAKKGKITSEKMREILKGEYGICNYEEFERAFKESKGINIGIFTMPLNKKSD